jgi:uncharacterized paraquat-inducible protein A
MSEFFLTQALPRIIVVGVFFGAALALTATYSRRGPTILLPYAGLAFAVVLLLTRYSVLSYGYRLVGALAAFLVATIPLYVAVGVLAARARAQLRHEGRVPVEGMSRVSRAWRLSLVSILAAILCAGIAFVAA